VAAVRIVDRATRLGCDNFVGLLGGERLRADREVIVRKVRRKEAADFIVVNLAMKRYLA
jgi:hypothetical protein